MYTKEIILSQALTTDNPIVFLKKQIILIKKSIINLESQSNNNSSPWESSNEGETAWGSAPTWGSVSNEDQINNLNLTKSHLELFIEELELEQRIDLYDKLAINKYQIEKEEKLQLRSIALAYQFLGKTIDYSNSETIAKEFGFNTKENGRKLAAMFKDSRTRNLRMIHKLKLKQTKQAIDIIKRMGATEEAIAFAESELKLIQE